MSVWRREKRVNFHKPTIFVYHRMGSPSLTVPVLVNQYLTQAFAFVYVIDTSNSGGVNKYRVGIEITLSFLKLLFF